MSSTPSIPTGEVKTIPVGATASWRSGGCRVSGMVLKANGFQTSAQAIHAGQVKVKLNLLASKPSSLIVLAQGGQHSDTVQASVLL